MKYFVFLLSLVFSTTSLLGECLPVFDINLVYKNEQGSELSKRILFVDNGNQDSILRSYRQIENSIVGNGTVIRSIRSDKTSCEISTFISRNSNRRFFRNARRGDIIVCWTENGQNVCTSDVDSPGSGDSPTGGLVDGEGETGNGNGDGGGSGGGSGGGYGNGFNTADCKDSPLGSGTLSVCGDDSQGVYFPGTGVVVVNPVEKEIESAIEESTEFVTALASNMAILANSSYSPLTGEEKKIISLNRRDFDRFLENLENLSTSNITSAEIVNIIERNRYKTKEESLQRVLFKRFDLDRRKAASVSGFSENLSPFELKRFVKRFVERSGEIDRFSIQNNDNSKREIVKRVNKSLDEIVNLNRFSPTYKSDLAAYRSFLNNYTSNGLVAEANYYNPQRRINLNSDLFSADRDERYLAARVRSALNDDYVRRQKNPEKASVALLSRLTDSEYTKGNKDLGFRYLDMLETFEDFEKGFGSDYEDAQLTAEGKSILGIDVSSSDFFSYQVIELANEIADYSGGFTEEAKLAASLYLRSTLEANDGFQYDFAMFAVTRAAAYAEFFAGSGIGSIKTMYRSIEGFIEFASHPIDSTEAVLMAIYNYEDTFRIISEAIEDKVEEIPNMNTFETGELVGSIGTEIVASLTAAGILKATGVTNTIRKASRLAASRTLDPIVKSARGYTKIRRHAPNLVRRFPRNFDELRMSYRAGEVSTDFLKDLGSYSSTKGISLKESIHISNFDQGYSYLIPEEAYNIFVVDAQAEVLGRVGYGQWVMSKGEVDRLLSETNLSAELVRKSVGIPDDNPGAWLKGNGLIRIDLEFDFDLNPRLPTKNSAGANELFIEGGKTSGGFLEILIDNPLVSKSTKDELGLLKE
ncbi:MAG: hypothetical protein HRU19_29110 [Pseudobacteriovorax sp.]|nr:hypothetical protein [Pseudobacteriovorax sp.]